MKCRVPFDHRWFALGSLFSLFSLVAIPTGEWMWLLYLSFLSSLLFLVPARRAAVAGDAPADPILAPRVDPSAGSR